jgi:uncharacterized membrane protein
VREVAAVTRIFFRWVLAVFFVLAGANHFRMPETYLSMIPPMLPWPTALNDISGAAEMLGGIGVLVPATRRFSGWGLIVLLIAVFPANLHAALVGGMSGVTVSRFVLWLRLPFQAVFLAWVWWAALQREKRPA